MLGRTLKMALWVTYDHIGKLILANIVWFLSFAVPGSVGLAALSVGDRFIELFIGVPLVIVSFGVILPTVTAGLAHMVKVLIDARDGSLADMFRGMRQYWGRATGIGLLYLFLGASLTTSAWFYATRLRTTAPWLGIAISGLAVWCLVLAVFAGMLVMPALVQKKSGVLVTLKLAVLLVLANPLFSVGLAIQLVAITAVSLVVSPLMPAIYGSLAVVLVSCAYELLARKYAEAEFEAAVAQGLEPARPRPPKDEEDDYLNRGFRDFLFPWKG